MIVVGMRRLCMGLAMVDLRMLMRRFVRHDDIHFGCGNAPARDLSHFETSTDIQGGGGSFQHIERNAGVHERAQKHIATYAGKAFQISDSHRE